MQMLLCICRAGDKPSPYRLLESACFLNYLAADFISRKNPERNFQKRISFGIDLFYLITVPVGTLSSTKISWQPQE